MKPSSLSTWAMATLTFEAGIRTASWREPTALRMRVSMSAIGSLTLMYLFPLWRLRFEHLPAGFRHAGQKASVGKFAEGYPREAELPDVALRAPGDEVAVVDARGAAVERQLAEFGVQLIHLARVVPRLVELTLDLGEPGGVLRVQVAAHLVPVH